MIEGTGVQLFTGPSADFGGSTRTQESKGGSGTGHKEKGDRSRGVMDRTKFRRDF